MPSSKVFDMVIEELRKLAGIEADIIDEEVARFKELAPRMRADIDHAEEIANSHFKNMFRSSDAMEIPERLMATVAAHKICRLHVQMAGEVKGGNKMIDRLIADINEERKKQKT